MTWHLGFWWSMALEGRPLGDLFARANTELTKSAAEIGYARFLYAGTHPQE